MSLEISDDRGYLVFHFRLVPLLVPIATPKAGAVLQVFGNVVVVFAVQHSPRLSDIRKHSILCRGQVSASPRLWTGCAKVVILRTLPAEKFDKIAIVK